MKEFENYEDLKAQSNQGYVLLVRMMGLPETFNITLWRIHKTICFKFGHPITYQSVWNWWHKKHLPSAEHIGWIDEAFGRQDTGRNSTRAIASAYNNKETVAIGGIYA